MKAWQLTAGWFTMIAAIATFIFKFAGREDLMMLCSGGICLMVTLYWVIYLCLRKKY
jgi:type II secretory pathway component PulM